MKKRALLFCTALLAVLVLAGCGMVTDAVNDLRATDPDTETRLEEGEVGKRMRTYFFDFTVLSAREAESFGDYTPEGDNRLVVVNIKTTNVAGEDIEMYDYDFQLQWGDRDDPAYDDAYADTLELDTLGAVPGTLELANGDSMTYDYVYEVPAGATGFEICYYEEFYDQDADSSFYGDIFFVKLGF